MRLIMSSPSNKEELCNPVYNLNDEDLSNYLSNLNGHDIFIVYKDVISKVKERKKNLKNMKKGNKTQENI